MSVPPGQSARASRRRRLTQPGPGSSLNPIGQDAALRSVGLTPLHEVMGVAVLTRPPERSMVWTRISAYDPGPVTSSMPTSSPPRAVNAMKSGYRTVLARLAAEAAAVGADGVVGVSLTRTESTSDGTATASYSAVGTAVRAAGRVRPASPFLATLSGADVAAALRGGWVPVSIVVAPVMAVRYVDAASRARMRLRAPNGEITAVTELITTCRRQARDDFADAVRHLGADGAVLSNLTNDIVVDHSDPVCRATVVIMGTALARFASCAGRLDGLLTVIPVDGPVAHAKGRNIP